MSYMFKPINHSVNKAKMGDSVSSAGTLQQFGTWPLSLTLESDRGPSGMNVLKSHEFYPQSSVSKNTFCPAWSVPNFYMLIVQKVGLDNFTLLKNGIKRL